MIKIIRVIARLNIGGPAIHAILLNSAFNNNTRYKDVLVCGKVNEFEGDMIYLAKEKMVAPVIIPELGREISFKKDLKAFFKLYRMMKNQRPNILHTHTAKAGTLGRLAAIFAGVPVRIHTFHGHIFDGYFSPFKAKVFLWVERILGIFTDRVVVVSEAVKSEIVGRLHVVKEKRCVVIPLGLELDGYLAGKKTGSFRRELGIGDETLLVGIIGRLVPIKNHRMFLDIAKCVRGKIGPAKVVKFAVIGDGELRDYLEDYSRTIGVEKDVIFTGWKRDLPAVYADLDVVLLTSLNEGTPVSLIEAMASGRPVVASDVGGVRDIVREGENGFLIKPDDIENFSKKVIDFLKDSKKRALFGERGRHSVRERYAKERLVKDIERLYDECLSAKSQEGCRRRRG